MATHQAHYRTLLKADNVLGVVRARFIPAPGSGAAPLADVPPNLIFFTPTSLRVYEVDEFLSSDSGPWTLPGAEPVHSAPRMTLLRQFDLAARLMDVGVVRAHPSDYLLLSFRDAKVLRGVLCLRVK
jgi:hypothetical protein